MNGITEPLPGLLDDPQFQITDLPALTDFHIAPLRNPAPTRHANVPLPLEPLADKILQNTRSAQNNPQPDEGPGKRRTFNFKITPNDVLLAREAKKPHLAISELLETSDATEGTPTQLPSFISLSVVEKSPVQTPSSLKSSPSHAQKRLRLDAEAEPDRDRANATLDMIRRLPRPAQKDDRPTRPAPLLPTMVTGLHEPPPSAALLPSIDIHSRPGISRTTSSKMNVKDMLSEFDQNVSPPPVAATTAADPAKTSAQQSLGGHSVASKDASPTVAEPANALPPIWKDNKPRRARRKWSEYETKDLLAGVKKYGVGKWKQILDDPTFQFCDRSSVDLKDRYRVCAQNESIAKPEANHASTLLSYDQSTAVTNRALPSDALESSAPTDSPVDLSQPPKQRRKRRAWTDLEDENLIKGVAKHGFQWTAIHDDTELDLQHRRATDLRDRIRNKFPDGYKHAETAPLRSEVKKAEKLSYPLSSGTLPTAANHTTTTTLSTPPASYQDTRTPTHPVAKTPTQVRAANRPSKISISSAAMANILHHENDDADHDGEKDKTGKDRERDFKEKGGADKDQHQPGVTLPSFTLGVEDNMDWEDNRLPPLHEWDEIGI